MSTPWQPPGPDAETPPSSGQPPIRPRYGELAPPGYVSPVPVDTAAREPTPEGAPTYYARQSVARNTQTADIVVTCILLFLGLLGMIFGIAAPALIPATLMQEYRQYGVSYSPAAALTTATTVILVSHIVLWLAALGGAIPLMVRRRIAFWVPLTAGVIAAIIFWGLFIAIIAADPALTNAIQSGH